MLCCPLSASAGDAEVRHELLSSCSMRFDILEIWRNIFLMNCAKRRDPCRQAIFTSTL